MQPHSQEKSAVSKPYLLESMTVDDQGVFRGGFSAIFAALPIEQSIEAAPSGKPTKKGTKRIKPTAGPVVVNNCKGGNCGNCTICPPPTV
jgi:hypothetical protein